MNDTKSQSRKPVEGKTKRHKKTKNQARKHGSSSAPSGSSSSSSATALPLPRLQRTIAISSYVGSLPTHGEALPYIGRLPMCGQSPDKREDVVLFGGILLFGISMPSVRTHPTKTTSPRSSCDLPCIEGLPIYLERLPHGETSHVWETLSTHGMTIKWAPMCTHIRDVCTKPMP